MTTTPSLLIWSGWRTCSTAAGAFPGLGIPIGIDGIASIFPVVGDSATGVVSAYLVYQASRMGVPRSVLLRMAGNAGLDWAVGSIPVLGTLFDIGFKANRRNVNLLRRHLEAGA